MRSHFLGQCICVFVFFTSAGVRVLCLRWSPRQVIVKISAAFTVQALCIMFAYTATVDLANQKLQIIIWTEQL